MALRSSPPDLRLMQRAEGELLLARRLDPEDPEITLLHAQFLEADGHIGLAAELLNEVLDRDPEHIQGLRAASRLRFELGEERRALPLLQRLLDLEEGDVDALYRLAHCQFEIAEAVAGDEELRGAARQEFLRAAGTFREYQARVPSESLGELGEAQCRFRAAQLLAGDVAATALAEFEGVVELLRRGAARAPNSPIPEHNVGAVFVELGRLPEARQAFERALERSPSHVPTLIDLASLLDSLGETESAKDLARRALVFPLRAAERRELVRYIEGGGETAVVVAVARGYIPTLE
jgi:tetratricopeptide (TPR) repeat protein